MHEEANTEISADSSLSSPARNALACAYRYPAVPGGISCRVSRPRFRSANKLAAIRPLTSCWSLSMSGRILSTKPAPVRYFAWCPTRAGAMLSATSASIATASRAASSPRIERPHTRHSMWFQRASPSLFPLTAPQQCAQRALISTTRAGPGLRSSDGRSSNCRRSSKCSLCIVCPLSQGAPMTAAAGPCGGTWAGRLFGVEAQPPGLSYRCASRAAAAAAVVGAA